MFLQECSQPYPILHRSIARSFVPLKRRIIVDTGGKHSTPHAAGAHRFGVSGRQQNSQRQSERMAGDVSKHLERAKRFLEKNRVEDAIEAYLAVLDEAPVHQEATQALGDLYARMDQPERAAVYYGMLFDLLVDPKDETKALAIYNRFLRSNSATQLPERIARYAFLQQKQNHPDEAIEQYTKAAELFTTAAREEDALFCWACGGR
jgi:tetratricopeptide (TPR) repeat protein